MIRRLLILTALIACCNGMVGAAAVTASPAAPPPQPNHTTDTLGDAAPRPPSAPAIHSQLDSEPIHRGTDTGATPTSSAIPHSQGIELPRVAGALAIVIALIFLLRWGGKKLFISGAGAKSTRAVQVLAKSSISPRQHILLLRVGQRVIVVGDGGGRMNPLSEITDPDEIASLLGQLQEEKSHLPAKAFNAIFNRARADMDGDADDPDLPENTPSAMSDDAEDDAPIDPSVARTRDEISGLMDKIRVVSKHFRGGQA